MCCNAHSVGGLNTPAAWGLIPQLFSLVFFHKPLSLCTDAALYICLEISDLMMCSKQLCSKQNGSVLVAVKQLS